MRQFSIRPLPENGQLYSGYSCPPTNENNSHLEKLGIVREDSNIVIEKTRLHPGRMMKHSGYCCQPLARNVTAESKVEMTSQVETEKSGTHQYTQIHKGFCCPPGEINMEITSQDANERSEPLPPGEIIASEAPVETTSRVTNERSEPSPRRDYSPPAEISMNETPPEVTSRGINERSEQSRRRDYCPPGEISMNEPPVEVTWRVRNERSKPLPSGDYRSPAEIKSQVEKQSSGQIHTGICCTPREANIVEAPVKMTSVAANERPGQLHSGDNYQPLEIKFTTDTPTGITSPGPIFKLMEMYHQQNGKENYLKVKQCHPVRCPNWRPPKIFTFSEKRFTHIARFCTKNSNLHRNLQASKLFIFQPLHRIRSNTGSSHRNKSKKKKKTKKTPKNLNTVNYWWSIVNKSDALSSVHSRHKMSPRLILLWH